MEKIEFELFIAMNEDGDRVVTEEESEALNKLAEECGGYCARVVKIKVKMAPPVITEVAVDVPDDAGETTEFEATAA